MTRTRVVEKKKTTSGGGDQTDGKREAVGDPGIEEVGTKEPRLLTVYETLAMAKSVAARGRERPPTKKGRGGKTQSAVTHSESGVVTRNVALKSIAGVLVDNRFPKVQLERVPIPPGVKVPTGVTISH